uniref:Uncharacterized protein n=1 Tax=Trichuris muris TaxID=70415 RepID=A0A5S6R4D0_TRIMR
MAGDRTFSALALERPTGRPAGVRSKAEDRCGAERRWALLLRLLPPLIISPDRKIEAFHFIDTGSRRHANVERKSFAPTLPGSEQRDPTPYPRQLDKPAGVQC